MKPKSQEGRQKKIYIDERKKNLQEHGFSF